jgi:hypothetical protein
MTADERKSPPGRARLLPLAVVFFLPLAVASWLYYSGSSLTPGGRTNHGAILEPIVNLRDTLPDSPAAAPSERHWLLIYRHEGTCGTECRDALHRLRQSRLMLGPDMDRVRRVFLHLGTAPDTVLREAEDPGLTIFADAALGRLLALKRPRQLPAGGFFLVDPLGNLVMYFAPTVAPGDMVDDIGHLLDLSRIG